MDMNALKNPSTESDMTAKLGSWIAFTDAIALSRLQSAPTPATKFPAQNDQRASVMQEISRARNALERPFIDYTMAGKGKSRIPLPTLPDDIAIDDAGFYTPYRRYHQSHQRQLEQSVQVLRSKVRQTVAQISPKLRQLALLDATYENILQEREANLLGSVSTMLERRFHQLRKAHIQQVPSQQKQDSPQHWLEPGAWLTRYLQDLHATLLDELDLRLQPTLGLLEAIPYEQP